MNSMPNRSKVI